MAQLDQQVTLTGVAQSNERVSELLRNLANQTPWFAKPELVEITSATVALSTKEQKRVYNFTIKVKLVRAVEAEKSSAPEAMPSGMSVLAKPAAPKQP
jgi:type IV pilus assembly protein PilN